MMVMGYDDDRMEKWQSDAFHLINLILMDARRYANKWKKIPDNKEILVIIFSSLELFKTILIDSNFNRSRCD